MNDIQWRKLGSIKAINKYQAQFGPQDRFECALTRDYSPQGDWCRIETFSLNGVAKMKTMIAANGSYSAVFAAI